MTEGKGSSWSGLRAKGGSLGSWIELTDVCVGWLLLWLGLGNVLVRGIGITKSSKESRMTWFCEMVWKGKIYSWKTTSLDTKNLLVSKLYNLYPL